jgi:hypothetical protein
MVGLVFGLERDLDRDFPAEAKKPRVRKTRGGQDW